MSKNRVTEYRGLRQRAIDIFDQGVKAANPYQAVKGSLRNNKGRLEIVRYHSSGNPVRCADWKRVHLIAFGKAACAMARAAQEVIPGELLKGCQGIAVTNYANVSEVENFSVIGAAHPLPDESGSKAAERVASLARQARQGELVLVLISGGGSALMPLPVENITLQEKTSTTEILLACGADITEINCVRKHLSQLKGGGLARLASPADLHTLILSDVVGNDLSSIASGPTVADPTTFKDAVSILTSREVWGKVPKNVQNHLMAGSRGEIPETPKPGDKIFATVESTLIGSNGISLDAIVLAAKGSGFDAQKYSSALCGEARLAAQQLVGQTRDVLRDSRVRKPFALLAGGETTVTLKGQGKGGRNQEMALAFALAAERLDADWVFLSGGTDGQDGPTDAAGGIVDPDTITRMKNAGIDPLALLNNNDSYTALSQSNDLLTTGATGTNVADLQILLVNPK